MEIGLLFLLGVAAVGGAIYLGARLSAAWKDALRRTARELDLRFNPGSMLGKSSAEGVVDGMGVTVDSYTVSTGKSSTTYTRVRVQTGLPGEITLRREGFGESFKKAFIGEDIELGLPAFDGKIVVRGHEADLLARLDATARSAVLEAVGGRGAALSNGLLEFRQSGLIRDGAKLTAIARSLIGMGRALRLSPGDADQRLAESALGGETTTFRLKCLRQLGAHGSREVAVETARQVMANERDPAVRLVAAEILGPEEALDAAWELAMRTPQEEIREGASVVIARWADRSDAAFEAVGKLLERARGAAVRAALEAFGRRRVAPPVAALVRAKNDPDARTRAAVASALGRVPGTSSERVLVDLLGDDHDDVKTEAAQALGEVGSLSAVEPLLPLTKGVFADRDVKNAAREAVEKIQSRSGGFSGGLTVAEEVEVGQLSAVEMEEGALSEVD